MKTAEQAIHDCLWKYLAAKLPVYESRPMKDVGYPFADFEDFSTGHLATKGRALPRITANLNIWDKHEKRSNVSAVCSRLMDYARGLEEAYGYKVSLRISDSAFTVNEDPTVTPSIWRGMISLVFDIL